MGCRPAGESKSQGICRTSCGCKLNKGNPCCYLFSEEHVSSIRDSCSALDHQSLDLVILGQVMASVKTSQTIEHRGYTPNERERSITFFFHEGIKVTYYWCYGYLSFIRTLSLTGHFAYPQALPCIVL